MTGAVIGLVAAYAVLGLLLLSLNLRSAWRWPIKAIAIVLTGAFCAIAFLAIEALLGWPTPSPPPVEFRLHGALVQEPDRQGSDGRIFLWLTPLDPDGQLIGPPRAHALPYSRALHEQTARAQADLRQGRPIDGATRTRRDGAPQGADSLQVELFAAPPPTFVPKAG